MSEKKPAKQGYKMFIVRGLWLKAGRPMPFAEFLKSDLLKQLALDRVKEVDTKRS